MLGNNEPGSQSLSHQLDDRERVSVFYNMYLWNREVGQKVSKFLTHTRVGQSEKSWAVLGDFLSRSVLLLGAVHCRSTLGEVVIQVVNYCCPSPVSTPLELQAHPCWSLLIHLSGLVSLVWCHWLKQESDSPQLTIFPAFEAAAGLDKLTHTSIL